jgi:hypothetical protein
VGYRAGTLTLDVYVDVNVGAEADARAENFGHAMHVDDSRLGELLCIWYLPSS